MKSFSSDLLALLQGNRSVWPSADFSAIWKVDLFQIGPALNGQMMYAVNGDSPITFQGNIYQPVQFGNWSRGAVSSKIGLEAGTMKLSVSSGQQNPIYFPGTSNAALLLDGIKFGLLDAAQITVYTVYSPVYGQVTGPNGGSLAEVKFVGEITNIDKIGLTLCEMTCSDLRYLLNVDSPQRVVSANCWWVLYSVGCTLNKANFSRTGTVAASSATTTFTTTAHMAPITAAGTFTQGYLVWTSGKNTGLSNYIRQWTPGSVDTIQLDVQPIFGLNPGDTFTIYQGCNHTFTACIDLQGGSATAELNFGGLPFVPVPETAI